MPRQYEAAMLHFEDFSPGQAYAFSPHTVTRAEIVEIK